MNDEKVQRGIDITNLLLYSTLFQENRWETTWLSWREIEANLREIAERLAMLELKDSNA